VRDPLEDDTQFHSDGIRTGLNGVNDTDIDPRDHPHVDQGKGMPGQTIIDPGPNERLNTPPNRLAGTLGYGDDDEVDGESITTGTNGLRETPAPVPRTAPANVPSQAELQAFFDRTLGRQANVWIKIIQWDQVDVGYDVGTDDERFDQPHYRFDYRAGSGIDISEEENIVRSATYNAAATLNVYILGSPIQVWLDDWEGSQKLVGYAQSAHRTPFIGTYGAPGEPYEKTVIMNAIAHEMAHNDMIGGNESSTWGLEHPWHPPLATPSPLVEGGYEPNDPNQNHTPVDQTTDRRRLMWPDDNLLHKSSGEPPGLLLKHEVDRIYNIPPAP
jgi:hypothetical protein